MELVIVVTVIGLLCLMALPQMTQFMQETKNIVDHENIDYVYEYMMLAEANEQIVIEGPSGSMIEYFYSTGPAITYTLQKNGMFRTSNYVPGLSPSTNDPFYLKGQGDHTCEGHLEAVHVEGSQIHIVYDPSSASTTGKFTVVVAP